MDNFKQVWLVTLSVLVAVGCDPIDGEADDDGPTQLRPGGGGSGGVYLNTNAIGGTPFSEIDLKGGKHDGVKLDKVLLKKNNGQMLTLDRVYSDDGEIRAVGGGSSYSGMQLVGSQWQLTVYVDGVTPTPATITIASANKPGGRPWQYTFTHVVNGQVNYLCPADTDGSRASIPIEDLSVDNTTGVMTTRNNTLYLACTSGAVGKAAQWGYAPWALGVDDFEATVRAVRADYCGDGVSWTAPGTPVQLKDVWATNNFATAGAATESLWSDSGAMCLGTPRVAGTVVACAGAPVPTCAANASLTTSPDALLWTKVGL